MLVAFKYDSDLFLYTCDYAELKRMADDRNKICDTYAEWLVEFSKADESKAYRDALITKHPPLFSLCLFTVTHFGIFSTVPQL